MPGENLWNDHEMGNNYIIYIGAGYLEMILLFLMEERNFIGIHLEEGNQMPILARTGIITKSNHQRLMVNHTNGSILNAYF